MKVTFEINDKIVHFGKKLVTGKVAILLIAILFFIGGIFVFSATISKPHTFHAGDTISASEINENFDALYTKVNELDAKPGFGAWDGTVTFNTVYHAETDGFVVAIASTFDSNAISNLYGYTDVYSNPSILRCKAYAKNGDEVFSYFQSFTMPVRKGDYWKVVQLDMGNTDDSLYWIPLGN